MPTTNAPGKTYRNEISIIELLDEIYSGNENDKALFVKAGMSAIRTTPANAVPDWRK